MEELHQPVLLSEVGQWLDPQPGESYLDLTAGYGGHASRILDLTQNYKAAVLCDRDEMAINYLRQKYAEQGVELAHTDFYSLVSKKFECGSKFDIILADFGVSSPQLDRGERGFSFQHDGNLDMRMDRRQELTAAEVVNHYSEGKLAEVFERFGRLRGRASWQSLSRANLAIRECILQPNTSKQFGLKSMTKLVKLPEVCHYCRIY